MIARPSNVVCVVVFAAVCAFSVGARSAEHHVILSGSGGEDEYQERFLDWSTRLKSVLLDKIRAPEQNVHLLADVGDAAEGTSSIINLESIRTRFARIAQSVAPEDDVFVYLIGHGSYMKRESKFHIPGPDLTATTLSALLDSLGAGRCVVLNSTSSSAGFVNELSAPNRIICTATKSVIEVNATQFMEFFIQGLEEGSADQNHDERISFFEACQHAAELTATWYLGESLLATEHAILDDNGDGLGTRLFQSTPSYDPKDDATLDDSNLDGSRAETCFLLNYTFPEGASDELVESYLSTLKEIDALKAKKSELESEAYYADLERLLLKAARTNREIRQFAQTQPNS